MYETYLKIKSTYNFGIKLNDKRVSVWNCYVLRPISFYLTVPFIKLNISANAVTLLSVIVAIAGCFLISFSANNVFFLYSGILLVNLFLLLDFVDGNVARYYKQNDSLGELYDSSGNVFAGVIVPLSAGIYLYQGGHDHFQFFGVDQGIWLGLAIVILFSRLFRRFVELKAKELGLTEASETSKNIGFKERIYSYLNNPFPLLFIMALLSLISFWLLFYAFLNVSTLLLTMKNTFKI